MRILITGADGFLGKNLRLHLSERKDVEIVTYTRENTKSELPGLLEGVSCVFHLAGINRTQDSNDFQIGNARLTSDICEAICNRDNQTDITFVLASSTQAERDNDYGRSKREAEDIVFAKCLGCKFTPFVFRLPNVFGKWCKPNYNSAVATFCHNIARELPITINDQSAPLTLVYIDDVISSFLDIIDGRMSAPADGQLAEVVPTYKTTVGEVAGLLQKFHVDRKCLNVDAVGNGLTRALYATYISYLPTDEFSYAVQRHVDHRGAFVEMIKTPSNGQFSYFTAKPGVTRGGHYHHTKTEKFLVIQGSARFLFRNMDTGEQTELVTTGSNAQIVDTAPGWAHDITNIGEDDLIVMLWANEVFNRDLPDTYSAILRP